jgi:transcriptional regulator with XRE-family HTH domain
VPVDNTEAVTGDAEALTLGQRLRIAREAAGLTTADAARRLGVLKSSWQAWEADAKAPRSNRLAMMAGVLGVSPSWLLSGLGDDPWERKASAAPAALLRDLRQTASDMATLNRRMRAIAAGLERLQRAGPVPPASS